MRGWGRGGMVGLRKALWEHDQALTAAARLLATECGTVHERGSRKELCPKCQEDDAVPATEPE